MALPLRRSSKIKRSAPPTPAKASSYHRKASRHTSRLLKICLHPPMRRRRDRPHRSRSLPLRPFRHSCRLLPAIAVRSAILGVEFRTVSVLHHEASSSLAEKGRREAQLPRNGSPGLPCRMKRRPAPARRCRPRRTRHHRRHEAGTEQFHHLHRRPPASLLIRSKRET